MHCGRRSPRRLLRPSPLAERDEQLRLLPMRSETIPPTSRRRRRSSLCPDFTSLLFLSKNKAYSKRLRHLPRTHRISLAWLSDVIGSLDRVLFYVRSELQAAGRFTKSFSSGNKFAFEGALVGIMRLGKKSLSAQFRCCLLQEAVTRRFPLRA